MAIASPNAALHIEFVLLSGHHALDADGVIGLILIVVTGISCSPIDFSDSAHT
jgi:hypothetical protein